MTKYDFDLRVRGMSTKPNQIKSGPRAKSVARLYAVQAVYQMLVNGTAADQVIDDFIVYRIGSEPDLKDLPVPEGNLFRAIVDGVGRQRATLDPVLEQHLKNDQKIAELDDKEPLLHSILLCGAYELMGHSDIDAPIIISDYLNVTHSYYEGREASMINGILDALKKLYRV